MPLLRLALASLRSRALTTALTVFSIALSIALLTGVDALRSGARAGFAGTVSRADLVVGARGGDLPLLLSTIFHIGDASNNIRWDTYQHIAHLPAVAWTIPISMGDSYRGYRVIATDENLYAHYRYRGDHSLGFASGQQPSSVFQAAVGSAVAKQLHLQIGQPLTLAHGVQATSLFNHDSTPFTVSGILQQTGTPIDRAVYITLLGEEAMHFGWTDGTPPAIGEAPPKLDVAKLHVDTITSFLLGARSRISTLYLQREINTYKPEPLTAIIPAYTLQQVWVLLDYADEAFSLLSAAVLVVGLLTMLVSLYTSLNERRREIAILRAVGMPQRQIVLLFVSEAVLIAAAGVLLGYTAVYLLLLTLHNSIERWTGTPLLLAGPSPRVLLYGVVTVLLAACLGLVPAWRAYRTSLQDGLQTA